MKKLYYTTPEVEIVEVAAEHGFSLSTLNDSMDYNDGGVGALMD